MEINPEVEQAIIDAAALAAETALRALADQIKPGDSGLRVKYEYIPDFVAAIRSEKPQRES